MVGRTLGPGGAVSGESLRNDDDDDDDDDKIR
jgi:hypothetical protein